MTDAMELDAWLGGFVRDPAFLARYPHYAAILARMTPVADPSVKRMAVSLHGERFYLHVNVESFLAEPQYLRGVLLHEVHHVALGHLGHPRFAGVLEPELLDLAMEMSANEWIEEALPDPIRWQAYAQLGIRAGQSTLERYERLQQAQQGNTPRPTPARGATEDGERRADDHRFLHRHEAAGGVVEHARRMLEAAIDEVDAHGPAGEEGPALLAGKSPGRLLEELTGVLAAREVVIDWKSALAMFVARARAPVHTYGRPSRRFPGRVGEVPGRIWSPRVIVRPSLLVAIDTSMSMTSAELTEVSRQLRVIAEHARVTIAECDVEVTRVYPFTGAITEVEGRGGTDLRPVFAPDFLGAQRPDGVVYFTDGEGPFPEEPPRVAVLWILTKPKEFACPWGERASLLREAPSKPAPTKKRRARARA